MALGAPVADTAYCNNPHADPIGGICALLHEHTGAAEGLAETVLSRVLWPLAVLLMVLLVVRAVRSVAGRGLRRSAADRQIQTLVHNVLGGGGIVVAASAALYSAGLDLGIFLTIGGLSTLAIGLAFQDLLRNVLAGILLLIERPFAIGDLITVDTLTGTVVTIELRTTALRLGDGRLAIIPNLDAFSRTVINLNAFERRQFTVSCWVPQSTDLEVAIRAARGVLDATVEAASQPVPRILPSVDLDGGVTLQLQYWLDYRAHDPDAVAASVVRRLQAALTGAPPPADLAPPERPAAGTAKHGHGGSNPGAAPRRRRHSLLRPLDPDAG